MYFSFVIIGVSARAPENLEFERKFVMKGVYKAHPFGYKLISFNIFCGKSARLWFYIVTP